MVAPSARMLKKTFGRRECTPVRTCSHACPVTVESTGTGVSAKRLHARVEIGPTEHRLTSNNILQCQWPTA
eukprot:5486717-Pleurochrysis_carterae.AAC.3